jgi:hypothetical protein
MTKLAWTTVIATREMQLSQVLLMMSATGCCVVLGFQHRRQSSDGEGGRAGDDESSELSQE